MARTERVRKRSASVCVRCRRQKIKCSGSQPCQSCDKRGILCIFNNMDQKVLVTRRYISELHRKVALIEKDRTEVDLSKNSSNEFDSLDLEDTPAGNERSNPPDDHHDVEEMGDSEPGLVNPLAADPPAFMSPGNGRIFYLGTSSNWSFTRRLLSLVHQHVHGEPLPTESLIFEGDSYSLDWDGWRTSQILADTVIPSFDHALHLINTVNFRCGQLYHLHDDMDFMKSFHEFYREDSPDKEKSLWYIHFLLILAFGKSFIQPKSQDNKPPGTKYFVKALQLLPDHHFLYSSPMISTEILCCIALFYQSLDYRSPAHNYVGQAMRMAMAHGMHTMYKCMPVGELGLHAVERCRKIWWTVYILDRHMSSIQGLPQSVDDRFVQTSLPSPSSPERERNTALDMHIELCRRMADINSTVYGVDGRINTKFMLSTKAALSSLAEHADKLCGTFSLHLDGTDHGISRTAAYLHLLYQQCVIIATRPLLFCFLKIRLDSPETCAELLNKSRNIRNLIHMCVESAKYSIRILHGLKSQGLLETFLNFDLESIFISTATLLLGPKIDPLFLDDRLWWLEKSYTILQEMVEATNQVARFRWLELQQLENTLNGIHQDQSPIASAQRFLSQKSDTAPQLYSPASSYIPTNMDPKSCHDVPFMTDSVLEADHGFGPVLTTAEMMDMADSIEIYDAEWVSRAMMSHDIW